MSYLLFRASSFIGFLLFLFCNNLITTISESHRGHPDRYVKTRLPSSSSENISAEYFEITQPLQTDHLEVACSSLIFSHDFGNTINLPPISGEYSHPVNCSIPWTTAVLEFSASCRGEQYDRIAAIWIEGVEILRTSTAEPSESGISWKVRKDVTKYSSLLRQTNLMATMMLENIVNEVYTGVYHVNVSVSFYGEATENVDGLENYQKVISYKNDLEEKLRFSNQYLRMESSRKVKSVGSFEEPADLIIPIGDSGDRGFWFCIHKASDMKSKAIVIPNNTYRAVLEIYVSFHSNDEFWYSNPPDNYIQMNNLTTRRGNGSFRLVFATIDGQFAGSFVPFPVIFTGGINPLFWEPFVAIGAFDLPSYDLDLTPFLGNLLDGKSHFIGLGITDCISYWLIDANLHLWLDHNSETVTAKFLPYPVPEIDVSRHSQFAYLDGKFKIESQSKYKFQGWVNSSMGNLTTTISNEFKFKNKIKFKQNGNLKKVEQNVKVKGEITVKDSSDFSLVRLKQKNKYPLEIVSSSLPLENDTFLLVTNVSHGLYEESSLVLPNGVPLVSSLSSWQNSKGWMMVQDHSVLSGSAETNQTYSRNDDNGCYTRMVTAKDGVVLNDNSTNVCARSMQVPKYINMVIML